MTRTMSAGEGTDTLDPPDPLGRLVSRTRGMQPWRRVFHAVSGVVLAVGPELLGLGRGAVLTILVLLLAGAVLLDVARLRHPSLNILFFRLLGPLASPGEAGGFASSTWYLLGVLLVYALIPARAVPAVLVLGLADPVASVVGRRWGRRRVGKGTLAGGGAFLAVAAIVLHFTAGGSAALVVAVAATVVELLPLPVDDNLSVPVATAVLLAVLGA